MKQRKNDYKFIYQIFKKSQFNYVIPTKLIVDEDFREHFWMTSGGVINVSGKQWNTIYASSTSTLQLAIV